MECLLLSLEIQPSVLWSTAVVINEIFTESFLDSHKVGLVVSCSQVLSQLLKRWREAIVKFVPRRPERITTNVLRRLDNFENSIVRWDILKGDAVTDY